MSEQLNEPDVIEDVCAACKADDHEHCLSRRPYKPESRSMAMLVEAIYGKDTTICCCVTEIGDGEDG
jgi:hypothetical protein